MAATGEHPAGTAGGAPRRRRRHRAIACAAVIVAAAAASLLGIGGTALASPAGASQPSFGPNVYIFSPSMPQSQIQATLDTVASQQVSNQFGTQRYALLFEPGTYGSAADPLFVQVGFYTEVAGLGASPSDVVINGAVNSTNQCISGSCTALDNFWRSLSNLTINYMPPTVSNAPCTDSTEFWAASQASPMRRVHINGNLFLFDYCSNPHFASGGFIADSQFTGGAVINGGQQQYFVRNSNIDSWSNGVWNQVFAGDVGAPAQDFVPGVQYTTLATSPVTQEEPFLQVDASGNYSVFIPALQHNSSGPTWTSGPTPGTSIPISKFFIAGPGDPVSEINAALASGQNLILTPGVYDLSQPIDVTQPNTVVLGLGFPTLVPQNGAAAMEVANTPGVKLSGMIIDAGPVDSPVLLQIGKNHGQDHSDPADPTLVQDVFFRIGGAAPGQADTSLVVNSSHVILDDIWAWRADHGNGVGWTDNVGNTGVLVNGDDVTAYGLFVEHYEQSQVIWNGKDGTDIFLQNEMPYDPPSQAAWMENSTTDGYPAFQVTHKAAGFQGYGMGSYSFFNQGVQIFATSAFEVDSTPGVQLHDLLTIFLNATGGFGGIDHVANDVGGSSTITNPDTPVDVVSYP
ncbi:MAG: adenylyl cyclase [Streptosporangiaceae bacterium]